MASSSPAMSPTLSLPPHLSLRLSVQKTDPHVYIRQTRPGLAHQGLGKQRGQSVSTVWVRDGPGATLLTALAEAAKACANWFNLPDFAMRKASDVVAIQGSSASPVSVPPGLKSSPSRVMQRVRTSLWKAKVLAVPASCKHHSGH
jgi:hypothetical protein